MTSDTATTPKTARRQGSPVESRASVSPVKFSRRVLFLGIAIGLTILVATIAAQIFFRDRRGTPVTTATVVAKFPHDRTAWTQGLAIADGHLYEGTGQYGESTLRRVDLKTGRVLQATHLDNRVFGEGIAIVGERIYQLSWKSRTCFVYDRSSFREIGRFQYQGEGWGLTFDGKHLIMSDGSSALRFMDPDTFKEVRRVWAKDNRRALTRLNELEFIEGEVWANIWYQDKIARIDPQSGVVKGYVELSHLWPRRERNNKEAVLNGIAYDASTRRLFVTGKRWPTLFEVDVKTNQ